MELVNPWENLKITLIQNGGFLQNYDDDIHILYVLKGNVDVKFDDKYLTLQKDDFLILNKAVTYEVSFNDAKLFEFELSYKFSMNKADSNFVYVFTGDSVSNSSANDQGVVFRLGQLLQLYVYREYKQNAFVFESYFALIGILEKYYRKKVTSNNDWNIKQKVKELKFYIDNNFEKDIKLADLANKLYLSEPYLSRLFTTEIGMPLTEYLIKKRLDKVTANLINTEVSITDIAFSAGFSSINSFNRVFKKYKSLTPSEFRKKFKQEVTETVSTESDASLDFSELKALFDVAEEELETEFLEVSIQKTVKERTNQYLINLGYAGDLLNGALCQQLPLLKKLGAFTYGRIWGLTSDDILPEEDGKFDFCKVDFIINQILQTNLIPFLELGVKGKGIYATHSSVIDKIPFVMKSNRMTDILERNRALFTHLVNQYGESEVSKWQVEVWRPNVIVLETYEARALAKIELDGKTVDITKEEAYIKYFSYLYETLKKIVPHLTIGGCGISLDIEKDNLKSFLTKWQQRKIRPDFISFSIFPMDELKNEFQNQKLQTPISPDPHYMLNKIKDIEKLCRQFSPELPLYITEFNVTILNRDIINDTAFKGAYIIKNCLEISSFCQVIGYWLFSDVTALAFDTRRYELFGGSGIVSKSGLPKIGYHAFDFLHRLGNQSLYMSDELAVTRTSQTEFQILALSYSHLNATYYYNSDTIFNRKNAYGIFSNKPEKTQKIILKNLAQEAGKLRICSYQIGKSSGNLLEEIRQATDKDELDLELFQYLEHRCMPKLKVTEIAFFKHEAKIELNLSPYDLIFLSIKVLEK
ncbi:GH39 family glycosyl hydrolase [Trichococcus shcherbakoviae]|uniref:GH39 family glycosyl hydrolase n=1 Tax=Trichococcus shcherbakoviae TaxID=2094020 RepID=UPI002AA87170|nr:helix-turn-helix domain-containing protein [Trichococcus shcherbakoviae]